MNTMRIGKSIERLSSGLRIDGGADDPSVLVLSELLRAQVSGLNVAQQNAEQGVKGKLIAYSPGNFVFAAPAREYLQRSGILIACFDTRWLVAASVVMAAIGYPGSRLTDAPHGLPELVGG